MSIRTLYLIQELLQPASLVWIMLSLGLVWQVWRRRWRAVLGLAMPWSVLTLVTCSSLPSTLVHSLEKRWVNVKLDGLPPCDVIVCLGGGAEPSFHEPPGFHLVQAGDRLIAALTAAGTIKAKTLVLGGGAFEESGKWHSEADAVKAWLDKTKLSPLPVTSLGACESTRDEAVKVAKLCAERGWKQVLLITSANHMNRAEATFRKAGVPVVCLPCGFRSSQVRIGDMSLLHLPHAEGFHLFKLWWHETVGWYGYRWRGWV